MISRKLIVYALGGTAALLVGVWAATRMYLPDSSVAQVPPGFWTTSLPDPTGRAQTLSQWRGKVLVVNFWATWCPPCRAEIPDFIELRTQFAPRNVEFVGIALDDAEPVADFARDLRVAYPILIGAAGAHEMARQLGNSGGGLPYTFVIDPAGKIVLRHLGRLPRATLEAVLESQTSS